MMARFQRPPNRIESVTIATRIAFTEGPAVDADGDVYFTDIDNNRIMRLGTNGERTVFREPSHRANGQAFDGLGRLYHCEEAGPGGGRRITRTNMKEGTYEIVTDRFQGARYNSPNDLCIDGLGRVYFSDPRYGDRASMEMNSENVFRIDTDGTVVCILGQPDIQRPNGVAVTQDGRLLYVVDSSNAIGGNRKLWCVVLDSDGNPTQKEEIYDFSPGRGGDGLELDIEGNIYVAAGISSRRGSFETEDAPAGVYVISRAGRLIDLVPVPEDVVTNVAFGGNDGRKLYITAGKTLFVTRVQTPGQVAYPQWSLA